MLHTNTSAHTHKCVFSLLQVQTAIKLARAEISLPFARLVAVISTVFVARLVLSASLLATHRPPKLD